MLAALLFLPVMPGFMGVNYAEVVGGRRPAALVVVPDEPEEIARYAAEELVRHIELATDVRLDIRKESDAAEEDNGRFRIYVGDTNAARKAGVDSETLGAETAIIQSLEDAILIVGKDKPGDPLDTENMWSGTLWGVYELLERELGVRWVWPGELGTYVPRAEHLVFDEWDEQVEPRFERRRLRQMRRHNDPRLGFSEAGEKAYQEAETVFLRRHRMGRSDDPRPYTAHRFAGWWRRYGEEHPEWFAMSPDGERGHSSQDRYGQTPMCVSNSELHEEIIRLWKRQRNERPGETVIIHLGEANSWARCVCEGCRAWDEPGPDEGEVERMAPYIQRAHRPLNAGPRYARFWKAVYEKAAEIDPDAVVTALAYMNYFAAPKEDLELHQNIVIAFVPWTTWWFPRMEEEQGWVKEQWRRWRELGATLYYRPNFTFDGYAMPHVYKRQFADTFRHHARHGMIATDFDSLLGQWAAQGPQLYLLARLHTRPYDETDELLEEYYSAFGPAANKVRRYFQYWEAHTMGLREDIDRAKSEYGASRFVSYAKMSHRLFKQAAFDQGRHYLTRAAEAASESDNQKYAERVRFLKDGLIHARLCAETASVFADEAATPEKRRRSLLKLVRFRRSVEDRFISSFNWLCRQERRSWENTPGFFEE